MDNKKGDAKAARYFAGPLNLNRLAREATTVMGARLELDENEFAALDLLVAREGEDVPFEEICQTVWKTGGERATTPGSRRAALAGLENLVRQVGVAGEGFMWIECEPGALYSFHTNWGHNWHRQCSV
ncbi:MAG: hypothetical protein FWG03_04750 [Clostridiales bacterium]|nr:hypothetical protein [Clostridiales bacterium]